MVQRLVESPLKSLTSFYTKYRNLSRKRIRNTTASRKANEMNC